MELPGVRFSCVGMCIEVDEAERTVAVHASEAGPVPEGDRVVTAQHDRHGTCFGDSLYHVGEGLEPEFEVAGSDLDVAGVYDRELFEGVDAGREMWPVHVSVEVVGFADCLRSESCTAA